MFPLAPSHHVDQLSFVKCFIDVAVYHTPSFSLAFISLTSLGTSH